MQVIYYRSLSQSDLRFFLSNDVNNSSKQAISLALKGSIQLGLSFQISAWYFIHSPFSALKFALCCYQLWPEPMFQIIILMSLVGKKILVLGGNGYLGNYFAAKMVQQQATVMALSRSGTKHNYPENQLVKWIKGSILEPQPIKAEINSADVIVHTIGTLFDTSVTKRVKPGGPGTYEQVNRDTLASLLEVLEKPKKIIYVSSAAHPPFLSRYLQAKHEAERLLFQSQHEGYSVRPGFIYSWQHRKWSIPIKWQIDVWNSIYPVFEKILPEKSGASRLLRQFKQGDNVALEVLGDAVMELSLNGGQKKVNEVSDIEKLCEKFRKQNTK